MGFKKKASGGYQPPQQPKISDDIVNPQYNIAPDGSVSVGTSAPYTPVQNPFMQQPQPNPFGQQQPNPFGQQQPAFEQPQPQEQYPVMNNDDRFDMNQPDQPNSYYESTGNGGQQPQQDQFGGYQQPQQDQFGGYQQPQQEFEAPLPMSDAPQPMEPTLPFPGTPDQGFDPNGGQSF